MARPLHLSLHSVGRTSERTSAPSTKKREGGENRKRSMASTSVLASSYTLADKKKRSRSKPVTTNIAFSGDAVVSISSLDSTRLARLHILYLVLSAPGAGEDPWIAAPPQRLQRSPRRTGRCLDANPQPKERRRNLAQ